MESDGSAAGRNRPSVHHFWMPMKIVVLAGATLLALAVIFALSGPSDQSHHPSRASIENSIDSELSRADLHSSSSSLQGALLRKSLTADRLAGPALQSDKRLDKTVISAAGEAMRQAKQNVEDLRASTGDALGELWRMARKGDVSAAVAFFLASSHSTVQLDSLAAELQMTRAELRRMALDLLQSAALTDPYAALLLGYQAGWMVPRSGMSEAQGTATYAAARGALYSLVERGFLEAYPVLVSTLVSGELGQRDISLAKFLLDYSRGTWEDDRRIALSKAVESGLKAYERDAAAELLARVAAGESFRSVIGSRL